MAVTISSIPGLVWDLYLEYLVFYQPNSWVATFAYVFRIIAIILFIPILALTLLDLVSYGLARTLGIIDTTGKKASSSEQNTTLNTRLDSLDPSQPHAYFTSEESNVKLAGGHDISPVASIPSSPILNRRSLQPEITVMDEAEEDSGLRKRH
ncbi:hypothetical protein BDZ89DRAFT_1154084 [Hymenopellis radicata]|nr:hypothetical protein BDZ89DRAFT_1154084 [Hymenopellis radicata]